MQHLKSLPADKLTVAKINGKTFYVFPDPAHNLLYVGNLEQYQSYQQILTYKNVSGQGGLMADLGEDSGDDSGDWVEWTNSTGWIHGTN